MNFIAQFLIYKNTYITSVSVPPPLPQITNCGCTLSIRCTFNYIILSMIMQFCTSCIILNLCVNTTMLQQWDLLSSLTCLTQCLLCCTFTWKNDNKNLFILLQLKMETETISEMWFFMQWIRIFNEDHRNKCNHHIR